MKLSIIIPCYNSDKYIKETIDSVKKQIYQDWECIIVNDGSTDQSEQIIKDNIDDRFILINTENRGVASARNLALKYAKGKYILPLDSDDILVNDYTFNGIQFLESNPEYSLYYGQILYFPGEFIEVPNWKGYKQMLLQDCICVSSIIRKRHAIEIGGWRTLEACEDYDFYIRYLLDNDLVMIQNKPCIKYRQREDSRHHSCKNKIQVKQHIKSLNKEIYDRFFNSSTY